MVSSPNPQPNYLPVQRQVAMFSFHKSASGQLVSRPYLKGKMVASGSSIPLAAGLLVLLSLMIGYSRPAYSQCFGITSAPAPSFSPSTGGAPFVITSADFNGDGRTDIGKANESPDRCRVHRCHSATATAGSVGRGVSIKGEYNRPVQNGKDYPTVDPLLNQP